MDSSHFKEFLYGSVGGLTGQILCYPFDTIKTRIQENSTKGYKNIYKGLLSPLTSVIIEKSLLFSSYDMLKDENRSSFISGVLAGVVTTLTVTPFERIKVRSQLNGTDSFSTLKNVVRTDGLKSLYRGWSAVMFREVPGYGLYFWVYENVKNKDYSLTSSFLTGVSCGVTAWVVIYPSDPIKTIMQNRNIGFRQSCSIIYKNNGLRGFYKGYTWGLIRAGILHGGVFVGYESMKKYF